MCLLAITGAMYIRSICIGRTCYSDALSRALVKLKVLFFIVSTLSNHDSLLVGIKIDLFTWDNMRQNSKATRYFNIDGRSILPTN